MFSSNEQLSEFFRLNDPIASYDNFHKFPFTEVFFNNSITI